MKYDEALKECREWFNSGGIGELDGVAFNIAINSLEKRIPQKPKYKEFKIILATVGEKTDGDFLCSCGSAVYSDYKFCPECGQALDWSSKNDSN